MALPPLPLTGGVVSYVKADLVDAGVGAAEGPGFFVQNAGTGPALYFALDPSAFDGGLEPGDVVDAVVTEGAWLSCSTSAGANHCSADVSIYAVTQAAVVRVGTGASLPPAQDLTTDPLFAAPIATPVGPLGWVDDTELVTFRGTIDGGFGLGAPGFEQAPFLTAGTGSSSDLALRLPDRLQSALGLFAGCDVTVQNVPLWRFGLDTELTAWAPGDVTVNGCPELQVLSFSPADGATGVDVFSGISVTFNSPVYPASASAQSTGGPCVGNIQVSTDGFVTCVGLTEEGLSAGNTVATFQPSPALSYGVTYQVLVVGGEDGVQAQWGGQMSANASTPAGFTTEPPEAATCGTAETGALVISQFYGGGGNSGAPLSNDFVELHNRSNSPIDVSGYSVQYAAAAASSFSVAATLDGSIPGGAYYLVELVDGGAGGPLPTPDATGSTNLNATAGHLLLVNDATAVSTCSGALDIVGYGSTSSVCREGTANAPPPSATKADLRLGSGCTDLGENSTDFATGTPAPRSSATAALVCPCAGSSTENESGSALEVGYCVLQFPTTLTVPVSTDIGLIYGRYYEGGLTPTTSGAANVVAELGYGPLTANPESQPGWTWVPATFNPACHTDPGNPCGNNDEYQASFTPPDAGAFAYTYRFSLDQGGTWTYCDLDGAGANSGLTFDTAQLPILYVTP